MVDEEQIAKVLQWPRWTRTEEDARVLSDRRAHLHVELRSMVEVAEREDRNLTPEETEAWERMSDEYDRLGSELPDQVIIPS